MNVRRVAALLLVFLLSQHALASTRIIHAMAEDSPCADCLHHSDSHAHHYDFHNNGANTLHSHSASMHQYYYEQKHEHEHHCEFCIGGCNTLMYSSAPMSIATHSFYNSNKKISLSIPLEPITHLYRPPIQRVTG